MYLGMCLSNIRLILTVPVTGVLALLLCRSRHDVNLDVVICLICTPAHLLYAVSEVNHGIGKCLLLL